MRLLSLLLSLLVISCATPSAETTGIVVLEAKPAGAVDRGRVSATAEGAGTLLHRQTYAKALEAAMRQAKSLGGTHLVLDQWYREPRFWGYDQSVKGRAYRLTTH